MKRINVATKMKWESRVGYWRAVRVGDHVFVTGTTATLPSGGHLRGEAHARARQALANVAAALPATGARTGDVVRTRIYVTDIARDWEDAGQAHADVFGRVRPATTMVEVCRPIEERMLVEVEADAIVGATRVESRRARLQPSNPEKPRAPDTRGVLLDATCHTAACASASETWVGGVATTASRRPPSPPFRTLLEVHRQRGAGPVPGQV